MLFYVRGIEGQDPIRKTDLFPSFHSLGAGPRMESFIWFVELWTKTATPNAVRPELRF